MARALEARVNVAHHMAYGAVAQERLQGRKVGTGPGYTGRERMAQIMETQRRNPRTAYGPREPACNTLPDIAGVA